MRSWMMLVAAMASSVLYSATPTISGVTARQRYPWNGKVDISYTVTGIEAAAKQKGWMTALKVTAVNPSTASTNVASSLTGDLSLADGAHKIVWDMNADGLTYKSTNVVFNVVCETTPALYCVVDLSAGSSASSYPVTYMNAIPGGSWSTAYKTTKLVLRRINAGSFKMQGSTTTTLTKPFFMGVFEVTQKQWSLVMGANPASSYGVGDAFPVYYVSYDMIRGSSNGAKWPSSSAVDATSFLGKLQARSGITLDLPTEAQWEYACRAGTTTTYYWGSSMDGSYAWYGSNSSSSSHTVGLKGANAWGLYDMIGNVWEWCIDWKGTLAYGTDPKGSSSGSDRVRRGGAWDCGESYLTYYFRGSLEASDKLNNLGFRLRNTLE